MISAKKTIDTSAWISLGILILLTSLIIWSDSLRFSIVLVVGMALLLSWLAGKLWRYAPRLTDAAFAISVSACLYQFWPHAFFDDAGFIMRYLDNLQTSGQWFRYNVGENPVFGISGFLHGLYCSFLVKFAGMSAERALHISNLTGLAAVLYFLAGIFRYFVHKPGWAYVAALLVAGFTKTWCDVLFTGMETPLHIAFIMGAVYFWLYGKNKWFYLFAALSVISKLDAVPVMAVLLLLHATEKWREAGFKKAVTDETKPLLVYFVLPLTTWIGFAYWFFGSPFPQSAKAKVLYHRAASDAVFPFLEGFINDERKHPMLWLLLALLIIHALLVKKKGITAITRHFVFGWMFVAIMVLYYFYNPNERMLWYYALPDVLITAQCILSGVWLATETKDWKAHALPGLVLLGWLLYLVPDANGARNWMHSYLERVERERYEMGKYIAAQSHSEDTLLAWHGLIARPFPGYVVDGTGLNSPRALELKIDRARMIDEFHPRYGVHHAYGPIMETFVEKGYMIKGMFGDVTLENWPAWIWWEKRQTEFLPEIRYHYQNLSDSMVLAGKVMHKENPLKVEGPSISFCLPKGVWSGKIWLLFEGRKQEPATVRMQVWGGDSLLERKDIVLPPYGQEGVPSLYTYGTGELFAGKHPDQPIRLEFLPTGADTAVKINNPIVEFTTHEP